MRVLLTNRSLNDHAGSELVTVELAEGFMRRGDEVTIYAPTKLVGPLDVSHLNVVSDVPAVYGFDLLWVHHGLVVYDAWPGHGSAKIVFNHMGTGPIEMPPDGYAGREAAMASLVLANCGETQETLPECLISKARLFQNPAPLAFETGAGVGIGDTEGAIIYRRDNLPRELEGHGLTPYTGGTRITGSELDKYEFVVTNGKTVQYCLRAGVPVYVYGPWGGPGWLTEKNFAQAEYFNFSGRGFDSKSRREIEADLADIPEPMKCPNRFKLEIVLDSVINDLFPEGAP